MPLSAGGNHGADAAGGRAAASARARLVMSRKSVRRSSRSGLTTSNAASTLAACETAGRSMPAWWRPSKSTSLGAAGTGGDELAGADAFVDAAAPAARRGRHARQRDAAPTRKQPSGGHDARGVAQSAGHRTRERGRWWRSQSRRFGSAGSLSSHGQPRMPGSCASASLSPAMRAWSWVSSSASMSLNRTKPSPSRCRAMTSSTAPNAASRSAR